MLKHTAPFPVVLPPEYQNCRLHKLGLHELVDGRLGLLNTKALERIADYYDRPPGKVPLL